MAPHDDYGHEVDRLSSEQVEAILRGRDPGDPAVGRDLAVVDEVRRSLLQEPPPGVAEQHLAAMAVARTDGGLGTRRRKSRVTRFGRRRLVVALAAALALAAGAAAALTLPDRPDQARRPVPDDVRPSGIADTGSPADVTVPEERARHGPNARRGSRSKHGQEVSDLARGTALQGCEKGEAVSERASEKADPRRQDRATKRDACDRSDRAHARGSGRGAEASVRPGSADREGGRGQRAPIRRGPTRGRWSRVGPPGRP